MIPSLRMRASVFEMEDWLGAGAAQRTSATMNSSRSTVELHDRLALGAAP
jgi:hypothetical protein